MLHLVYLMDFIMLLKDNGEIFIFSDNQYGFQEFWWNKLILFFFFLSLYYLFVLLLYKILEITLYKYEKFIILHKNFLQTESNLI